MQESNRSRYISEQAGGFFAMIEENRSLPFVTRVLGQAVTVVKVDVSGRDQIVAICAHGKATQAIPILDLPLSDPPPEGRNGLMPTAAGAGIDGGGLAALLHDSPVAGPTSCLSS